MKRLMMAGLCAAALAVLAVPAARADVLYDNFGPGDSYQTGIGWTIGAPGGGDFWEQGDPFDVSGTYTLSQVTAAGGWVVGPNKYVLFLMDDAGGQPGNVIEEYDFSDIGQFGGNNPTLVGVSYLNPELDDGNTYWLIASCDPAAWCAWNWNNTGDAGLHAWRTNGGPWSTGGGNTRGAYRVEADPIGPTVAQSGTSPRPVIQPTGEGPAPAVTEINP